MRLTRLEVLVAGLCLLVSAGCRDKQESPFPPSLPKPTVYDFVGVKSNAPQQTRVGYLSSDVMQHPMVSSEQDYLDLYDKEGNWRNQIVIVFGPGVAQPKDVERPIEVKGQVGIIDLAGPEGTKGEYANDVVIVRSWRYLDSKDIPRKRNVEPEPQGEGLKPAH
ncbi:MAG: hypothetical protein HY343_06685 [Lentisphaerae bacterium]|nr:hypothetical protein [Lentisphaerota bacterium]